jgi:hypothetical protein
MDVRRLRAGEWVAGLSGGLLLVSLFLPWYGPTAWEALAVNDVLLALIAAVAVALPLITATQGVPAVPVAFGAILALAGAVATALVLIRVAWPPDGAGAREPGIWLALAGAVGSAAGGWLTIRDERLSAPGRTTDATGRPAAPPDEIEPIAPPRPEAR